MWNMINVMQLIMNMPLLNIEFPQNAVIFYNFINSVANFNLIPPAWINDVETTFTGATPSATFQNMGFNTDSIIQNMGSGVAFLGAFVIALGLIVLLKLLESRVRL